jgi:hypothetical protein
MPLFVGFRLKFLKSRDLTLFVTHLFKDIKYLKLIINVLPLEAL